MQAQFRLFLAGVAALVILVVLGTWYLGPNLLYLAFFAEGRNDPYLAMDFRKVAANYTTIMLEHEEAWRATFAADWQLTNVLEGRVGDEWPVLTLSSYDEAGSVVQFVTSASYRELLEQDPDFDHLIVGSFETLLTEPNPVLVVWMTREVKSGMHSLTRLISDLPADARIVWQGEITQVQGARDPQRSSAWEHGVIVGFNSLEGAVAYVSADSIKLERELVRSRVAELFLAIYVNRATN